MIQNFKKNKTYISFIELIKSSKEGGDIKRILNILEDDDLEKLQTPLNHRQRKLLYLLDDLILDTIGLLSLKIDQLVDKVGSVPNVLGLITKVDKKLLQIMKLRMTILPEITPSIVVHSVTKHKYVVLRSYWLNQDFKKIRKYSVSLGNLEKIGDVKKISPSNFKQEYEELSKKMTDLYHAEYS